MKLQRATFLGIRGLRDADLDFTDPETGAPHDVIIVAGDPASGRTRLLEAIVATKEVLAPYGPAVWSNPWVGESGAAKVMLAFHLDEEERTFAGTSSALVEAEATFLPGHADGFADEGLRAVLGRYAHGAHTGKLEYFPATREIPAHPAPAELTAAAQRALRPTRGALKYSFVPRFLAEIAAPSDPSAAEAFAERLAALSSTCRYQADEPRGFRSRGGPPVPVSRLSDGERDAVLLAATAIAIDLQCSLVLVDRPDLHAGPTEARGLLAGLRALGADNQLILAPRAPAAFAGAQGACVVTLEGL